jgi:hypothetical protein
MVYKMFAGILEVNICDSVSIVPAVKQFYVDSDSYLEKVVMFTSVGVLLCLERKMERRQHWKQVSRMHGTETVLKDVRNNSQSVICEKVIFRRIGQCYSVWCIGNLNSNWSEDTFKVLGSECTNEKMWYISINSCMKEINSWNNEINKYWPKMFTDQQYRIDNLKQCGTWSGITKHFLRWKLF